MRSFLGSDSLHLKENEVEENSRWRKTKRKGYFCPKGFLSFFFFKVLLQI